MNAVLLIDGECETSLEAFIAQNADDLEPGDIRDLRSLKVGDVYELIGGAFADMTIERVA